LGVLAGILLLSYPAAADTQYTVREGDSVWSIARAFGVSHRSVLAANGLAEDDIIRPGRVLTIPGVGAQEGEPEPAEEVIHVVAEGESLWLIARRYGTTVSALAAANDLDPHRVLSVGARLRVPLGASGGQRAGSPPPDDGPRAVHVVRSGESLWLIARRYGTTVSALAAANGIRPEAVLPVGRRLEVPGAPAAATESAEPGEPQHDFVETALEYQGVRYRYGGMTTRGMDCSGLVARVLGRHGIDAPRTSRALYGIGTPVSKADLEPGDLVFFSTVRAGVSHVGIYIGGNRFIHASSRGGGVRIDRLDTGYYRQRYVGARRVN